MNPKKMLTAVIGLAIAVVLVAGMMVPILSGLSGNTVHRNIGEYHYTEAREDTDYTITITQDEESITLTYGDTVVVKEKTLEGWMIPLFTTNDGEERAIYNLIYFPQMAWGPQIDNEFLIKGFYIGSEHGTGEYILSSTITILGDQLTWTYMPDWKNARPITLTFTAELYIADEGDYVYAEKPIVNADTEFYAVDIWGKGAFYPDIEYVAGYSYIIIGSYGAIDTITDTIAMIDEDCAVYTSDSYQSGEWGDWQGSVVGPATYSENSDGTYRFDGYNVKETWTFFNDDENPYVQSLDVTHAIVPTVIEVEGSGLSDTITSMISVIPLITILGIIVAAVTFMRKS